jgi:hypothetical protein
MHSKRPKFYKEYYSSEDIPRSTKRYRKKKLNQQKIPIITEEINESKEEEVEQFQIHEDISINEQQSNTFADVTVSDYLD